MSSQFRGTPKIRLQAMIPVALHDEIRRRAYVERRPENAVVTELLCLGTGIEPHQVGLGDETVHGLVLS